MLEIREILRAWAGDRGHHTASTRSSELESRVQALLVCVRSFPEDGLKPSFRQAEREVRRLAAAIEGAATAAVLEHLERAAGDDGGRVRRGLARP